MWVFLLIKKTTSLYLLDYYWVIYHQNHRMDIGKRINARKIMLSYMYTDFFYRWYTQENEKKHQIIDNQNNIWEDHDFLQLLDVEKEWKESQWEDIVIGSFGVWWEEKDFSIIASGLRIDLDEVDWDYISIINTQYHNYEVEVEKIISPLLTQFKRNDLEAIKKAIFVLGYTEYRECGTDEKVVINEMIELAKRFGGNDVYKLVNGVFHKLLMS